MVQPITIPVAELHDKIRRVLQESGEHLFRMDVDRAIGLAWLIISKVPEIDALTRPNLSE